MGSAEAMAMAEARGLAVYVITQAGDRTESVASRAMKPLLLDDRQ
jgi:hypothetical protein